jgi:hypothetical protein
VGQLADQSNFFGNGRGFRLVIIRPKVISNQICGLVVSTGK